MFFWSLKQTNHGNLMVVVAGSLIVVVAQPNFRFHRLATIWTYRLPINSTWTKNKVMNPKSIYHSSNELRALATEQTSCDCFVELLILFRTFCIEPEDVIWSFSPLIARFFTSIWKLLGWSLVVERTALRCTTSKTTVSANYCCRISSLNRIQLAIVHDNL